MLHPSEILRPTTKTPGNSTWFFLDHPCKLPIIFRDCQQITFVTLNRFCPLSKPQGPLFLMDNIMMERIPTKIKWKMLFYTVFQVLKLLLMKNCKIQPPDLSFLVVFISCYISRYHLSHIFKTSFNIHRIIDFCYFLSNVYFSRNESPSKTTENVFYFI